MTDQQTVNRLLRSLLAESGRRDPYPRYKRFAELGPVVLSRSGWVVVSGHEECVRVLRDPLFVMTGQLRKTIPSAVVDSGFPSSMLGCDGAQHRAQRSALAGDFTGRVSETMRPVVAAAAQCAANSLAEALDRHGTADVAELVAGPVPAAVIGRWSGAEEGDWPVLRAVAMRAHHLMEMGLRASRVRIAAEAFAWLRGYFDTVLACSGEDRQRRWPWSCALPDAWVSANLALLTVAGTVTTSGLIGSTVLEMSSRPLLWEAVRDGLAAEVAEEADRFDGPAQLTCRVASQDVVIGDVSVRAGAPVVLLLGAANRDPRVWKEPEMFDIHRDNADKALGFSHGRHRCVGAALATMQVAEVLSALSARVGPLRVVEHRQRGMLSARGPERLIVTRSGA